MTQERKHPHNRKRKAGKHPNWGGRRPGAGAPKGNMNANKHGRRSRQMADLVSFFVSNPKTHATLDSIRARWERADMKAQQVATRILSQIIERGLKRGEVPLGTRGSDGLNPARLSDLQPIDERHSIESPTLEDQPGQTGPQENRAPSIKNPTQPVPIDQDPYGKTT